MYVEQLALAIQTVPFETHPLNPLLQAAVVVPLVTSEQTITLQTAVVTVVVTGYQIQRPSVP